MVRSVYLCPIGTISSRVRTYTNMTSLLLTLGLMLSVARRTDHIGENPLCLLESRIFL